MVHVTIIFLPPSSRKASLSWKESEFLNTSRTPLFLRPDVQATVGKYVDSLCASSEEF